MVISVIFYKEVDAIEILVVLFLILEFFKASRPNATMYCHDKQNQIWEIMKNCCVVELIMLLLEADQNSLAAKAVLKCSGSYLSSAGAGTPPSI